MPTTSARQDRGRRRLNLKKNHPSDPGQAWAFRLLRPNTHKTKIHPRRPCQAVGFPEVAHQVSTRTIPVIYADEPGFEQKLAAARNSHLSQPRRHLPLIPIIRGMLKGMDLVDEAVMADARLSVAQALATGTDEAIERAATSQLACHRHMEAAFQPGQSPWKSPVFLVPATSNAGRSPRSISCSLRDARTTALRSRESDEHHATTGNALAANRHGKHG